MACRGFHVKFHPLDYAKIHFYIMKTLLIALLPLALGGCSTYMPQRYSISADNNVTLKAIGVGSINVGTFMGPTTFDKSCMMSRSIAPPDNMSFAAYIQKALADELKVAGMFDEQHPKATLTGVVEQLSFSVGAFSGGQWNIGLRVNSSNGKSIFVSEHYEFSRSFMDDDDTACIHAADAFLAAVQDLIGKLVKASDFKSLLMPI